MRFPKSEFLFIEMPDGSVEVTLHPSFTDSNLTIEFNEALLYAASDADLDRADILIKTPSGAYPSEERVKDETYNKCALLSICLPHVILGDTSWIRDE